jgi:hypothetical protein
MMIGLLQSGTGIGSGICPPSFASGLLDFFTAGLAGVVRAVCGEGCLKAASAAPCVTATPATPLRACAEALRCAARCPCAPARPEDPPALVADVLLGAAAAGGDTAGAATAGVALGEGEALEEGAALEVDAALEELDELDLLEAPCDPPVLGVLFDLPDP